MGGRGHRLPAPGRPLAGVLRPHDGASPAPFVLRAQPPHLGTARGAGPAGTLRGTPFQRECRRKPACRSDFHLPGTYRGGMVARLQRLLVQHPDGTFTPGSTHADNSTNLEHLSHYERMHHSSRACPAIRPALITSVSRPATSARTANRSTAKTRTRWAGSLSAPISPTNPN